MTTAEWLPIFLPAITSVVGIGVSTLIVLRITSAEHRKSIEYLEKELQITRRHVDDLRGDFRTEIVAIHQRVIEKLVEIIVTSRSNGK